MLLQKRTSSAIFVAIDTKKQRIHGCLFKKNKYEQHALADCRNDDQQLFKKTKQYLLMRGEIK